MIRLFNNYHQLLSRMQRGLHLLLGTGLFVIGTLLPSSHLHAQERNRVEVVRIQPFELQKSYPFDWRKERPQVKAGLLVVFRVDTSMVRPTNMAEPVLYAGNHTVQRINQGYGSGFVVGIIPAEIDLSREPVWFGSRALPEDVDEKTIRAEKAKAVKSGIRPQKADAIKKITLEKAALPDLTTLLRKYAADLILQYAPEDKHLVEQWRLPETGK